MVNPLQYRDRERYRLDYEGMSLFRRSNVTFTDGRLQLALIVISRCGFGNPVPWNFTLDTGPEMSFARALAVVSQSHLIRMIFPKWAYKLPIRWYASVVSVKQGNIKLIAHRIQDIDRAFVTLDSFMQNMVKTKRESIHSSLEEPDTPSKETSNDIFTLMMRASEREGNLAMTDSELVRVLSFID